MNNAFPYILLYLFLLFLYYRKKSLSRLYSNVSRIENQFKRIAFFTYLIFYGLRGYIFTDCFQYHEFYEELGQKDITLSYMDALFEPGYIISNIILHSISSNPFFFQFIWTLIDLILLYLLLRRESNQFFLLAFAFLIPFFDGIQMNLFRNIKAILIFFLAIKYIRQRNLLKYTISIFLASTFHLTAWLFWPLYFFIHKNIPKSMIIVCSISVIFYFVGLGSLFSDMILIANLIGGKAERITNSYIDSSEETGFTFGFIYRFILMIYFLVLYKKISSKNQCMLNLGLIYICCSMIFNDVLVMRDRFTALFALSLPCLLPYVAPSINNKFAKNSFIIFNLLCTFAYTYVQHTSPAAKYENLLFGISDKDVAERRVFDTFK
jgi:hypothetical protein